MALKTVADLENSVSGLLSGLDLSNVSNLTGAIERAVRTQSSKIDMPEGSYIQNITLYSGVFDYAISSLIFGNQITDIRPQGISRSPGNFARRVDQETFDLNKNVFLPSGTMVAFQYANGVPTARIVAPFVKMQAILDPMNDTTGWTAAGNASGLTQDTVNFYQSPASLRFTLTGASVGTLTKTISTTDLSIYEDVGVAFMAIQIPAGATAANLSSIELRIGSSASNYNSVTATTGFLGAWIAGNWLLVSFDLSAASETGTPVWTTISYIQALFTTAGTITNMRVGGLWLSFPTSAQLLFQSAAIFLPVGASTAQTNISATTDTIILNDPAYVIFEYETAIAICEQTGGTLGSALIANFNAKLNGSYTKTGKILIQGLYDLYRANNPSQVLRSSGSWYDNDVSYGGFPIDR